MAIDQYTIGLGAMETFCSFFSSDFFLLVLSETVLVLERMQRTEPIFDHQQSYRIAKSLNGSLRHARDQWLQATQSVFPDRSSFRFGMRCD
jgi:hypothetical protein